jgi:hypothetical protein
MLFSAASLRLRAHRTRVQQSGNTARNIRKLLHTTALHVSQVTHFRASRIGDRVALEGVYLRCGWHPILFSTQPFESSVGLLDPGANQERLL